MGVYSRLKPKQSCVLCAQLGEFCICHSCQSKLSRPTHRCQSCASALSADLEFCGACLRRAPIFSRAYALYDYNTTCAQLIKCFKFEQQLCVGDFFAKQLYGLFQTTTQDYDAIIPLPLNKRRIRERGYNQTQELLREIAKNTDIVIDIQSVDRVKDTRALSQLSAKERQREIQGAFTAKPLSYQRVLLIDDVMTTGASMSELSKTLIQTTDIETCDVLVLARA